MKASKSNPPAQVNQYPLQDEWPHQPSGDPNWQESVAFTWWDDTAGIGGFHRLGHEIGSHPVVMNWNGVCTRDGQRFRRNIRRPLTSADRLPHGFACAPLTVFSSEQQVVYTLRDNDCELNLTCFDFYPRSDLFPSSAGMVADEFAAKHFEVACRVQGTARVGSRDYQIDGLGYRDHSWGRRDWGTLLSHRWVAGTLGPEFSFCALAWHATNDTLYRCGVVVRGEQVIPVQDVDIVTYMEIDSITCRGGEVTFSMPGAEPIHLRAQQIDSLVSYHGDYINVDAICTVESDGRRGFCDFEISSNPRMGTRKVKPLVRAFDVDGLSRRSL